MPEEGFTVIVHRDYPGEHDADDPACWCGPVLVDCEDPRTPEEVLADVEAAEAAEVAH